MGYLGKIVIILGVAMAAACEPSGVGGSRGFDMAMGEQFDAERIQEIFSREIPLGSTRAEVTAWLDGRNLKYRSLDRETYREDRTGTLIVGFIDDPRRGGFVQTTVRYRLYFDGLGNLEEAKFDETYTGP